MYNSELWRYRYLDTMLEIILNSEIKDINDIMTNK